MSDARKLTLALILVGLAAVVAATLPSGPAASAATQVFHECKSVNVYVFPERIHVRCDKAKNNIIYFAVSTANSAHAARVLSVLVTAHAAGRTIAVVFDPNDTTGTQFGCAANDCRRLLSVGVL